MGSQQFQKRSAQIICSDGTTNPASRTTALPNGGCRLARGELVDDVDGETADGRLIAGDEALGGDAEVAVQVESERGTGGDVVVALLGVEAGGEPLHRRAVEGVDPGEAVGAVQAEGAQRPALGRIPECEAQAHDRIQHAVGTVDPADRGQRCVDSELPVRTDEGAVRVEVEERRAGSSHDMDIAEELEALVEVIGRDPAADGRLRRRGLSERDAGEGKGEKEQG
jgi:hypothetical protein